MINDKEEFKLGEDLEQLVNGYFRSRGAIGGYKSTMTPEETSNYEAQLDLIKAGKRVKLNTAQNGLNELEKEKDETMKRLNDEAKPVYDKVKKGFVGKLDEDMQAAYYMQIVKEGVFPEKPSEKLKKIAENLRLAKQIENMLESNNVKQLAGLLERRYNTSARELASLYTASGDEGAIKAFASDKMEQIAGEAHAMLKRNKELYAEVDGAVDKAKNGYGIAVASAYSAYNTQKEIEKKKAEEKAKKANEAAKLKIAA